MRNIVSGRCGVGRAAVGEYLKDHRAGDGITRRWPVEKGAREISLKSAMPEGGRSTSRYSAASPLYASMGD